MSAPQRHPKGPLSPPRRQRPQQNQTALFHANVLTRLQVFEQAADHFTGAADVFRQFGVRHGRGGAKTLSVEMDGMGLDPQTQAAVCVEQCQIPRLSGCHARLEDHLLQKFQSKLRFLPKVVQQGLPVNAGAMACLNGLDGGTAWAAIERHFAHAFNGMNVIQNELATLLVGREDPQTPGQQNIQM